MFCIGLTSQSGARWLKNRRVECAPKKGSKMPNSVYLFALSEETALLHPWNLVKEGDKFPIDGGCVVARILPRGLAFQKEDDYLAPADDSPAEMSEPAQNSNDNGYTKCAHGEYLDGLCNACADKYGADYRIVRTTL